MKNRIKLVFVLVMVLLVLVGCQYDSYSDQAAQRKIADNLANSQKTPTDIEYSLERYNLIRRAYWVNGMRERANALPCEIEKPFGYIVLFSGNATVGSFVVDGKVSSLNSFLTASVTASGTEIADVDGSYGENDSGIFFFTPDGKYIEWSGDYLYSDIPFVVDAPMVYYEVNSDE